MISGLKLGTSYIATSMEIDHGLLVVHFSYAKGENQDNVDMLAYLSTRQNKMAVCWVLVIQLFSIHVKFQIGPT